MIVNLKDYKQFKFDSVEEYITFLYFKELKEAGFVKDIILQPKPFKLFFGLAKKFYKFKQLKTKIKKEYRKSTHLINPHIYTTDFKIIWEKKGIEQNKMFHQSIDLPELDVDIPFMRNDVAYPEEYISYIEVKPKFDHHNMTRLFTSRTQPWMWAHYMVYVQLVKPYDLMKKTFIPDCIMHEMYYKKDINKRNIKKGDRKFNWDYKTLKQYLNE